MALNMFEQNRICAAIILGNPLHQPGANQTLHYFGEVIGRNRAVGERGARRTRRSAWEGDLGAAGSASRSGAHLTDEEKSRCLAILQRHTLWQYGGDSPYGPKDKALILG